ncbi:ribonuclease H-like domain-containing protein [Tanacetum coccineum]
MDTCSSSYLNSSTSNLSTIFNQRLFPSVFVGDGKTIPVTNTGHIIIPSAHRPLHLHNVLVTPNIIKNLIYVRQFTRDNNCTIEFDAFSFSVKDYLTRHILLRCDSSDDLYPVTKPSTLPTAFVSTSSSTWHQCLGHPVDEVLYLNWHNAMYNVLIKNGTWILIPRPIGVNLVCSIWLYKHKYHENETLSRYKSRLVANRSIQQQGIDVDETFSSVVKPATIRIVLSLTVSRKWPIHQLDVKNAFLNGDLSETTGLVGALPFLSLWLILFLSALHCLLQQLSVSLHRESWSYAVQHICLYMHDPMEPHFAALKRILRYVQGTVDFGLQSTSGYSVFLGDNLLSFLSKRQHTISRSSVEAEYHGIANVVAKTAWLRNLLPNPVQHQQMKHIEINIYFFRDMVTAGHVRALHVLSRYQFADIFTKGLPSVLFEEFRASLSVCLPLAPTARAY